MHLLPACVVTIGCATSAQSFELRSSHRPQRTRRTAELRRPSRANDIEDGGSTVWGLQALEGDLQPRRLRSARPKLVNSVAQRKPSEMWQPTPPHVLVRVARIVPSLVRRVHQVRRGRESAADEH